MEIALGLEVQLRDKIRLLFEKLKELVRLFLDQEIPKDVWQLAALWLRNIESVPQHTVVVLV